jgi:hypothetical protein
MNRLRNLECATYSLLVSIQYGSLRKRSIPAIPLISYFPVHDTPLRGIPVCVLAPHLFLISKDSSCMDPDCSAPERMDLGMARGHDPLFVFVPILILRAKQVHCIHQLCRPGA